MNQFLEKRKKQRLKIFKSDLFRVIGLAAFFIGVGFLLNSPVIREHFLSIEWLSKHMKNDLTPVSFLMGKLLFILTGAILMGLGFPRTFYAAIAGSLFGFGLGVVLALCSSISGSLLNYWLGKSVLRSVIKNRFNKKYQLWKERIQENAFWWVLVARLIPFMNGTLMNLILGALKTPLRSYIFGSILGFAPLSIVFALFGHGAKEGSITYIVIAASLLLAVQSFMFVRWKKQKRTIVEVAV